MLIGPSIRPANTTQRVPMNVEPAVRTRLRELLHRPVMRGVGYSEFLMRAILQAEDEADDAMCRKLGEVDI